MEENRIPKGVLYTSWETQEQEAYQEIDGRMKCGRMEEWLVEKSGRKKRITARNHRILHMPME
jgi:hypothetical protein